MALKKYVLFFILSFLSTTSWAQSNTNADSCPVNVDFNDQERQALRMFNLRLEGLMRSYGRSSFQTDLSNILEREFPDKKVTEISPAFYERVLHLIDQQYLWNDIELTVGKNDPLWWGTFKRLMQNVTHYHYGLRNWESDRLQQTAEQLAEKIQNLTPSQMRKRGLSEEEANIIKARALTSLQDVYMYIVRQEIINTEISRVRMNNRLGQLALIALGLVPGGIVVATTIRAGVIIAAASRFAASYATDAIVAARLARTGQILGGAGIGAVGAPSALLATDVANILLTASRMSENNDTLYLCELNNQIQLFRSRGVRPYLKAIAVGGSIGLVGGSLTLTAIGARTVLYATAFGVGVAQLYSVGAISANTLYALAEYRKAQEAMDAGNRELAIQHLQQARQYTQEASEAFLDALIISVLSGAISREFSTALREGEQLIRTLFASSTDTLPTALQNAQSALDLLIQQTSAQTRN